MPAMVLLLLLAGTGLDSGYSSTRTGRGWKPGEQREVTKRDAAYLMETYPGCFREVDPAEFALERARQALETLREVEPHLSEEDKDQLRAPADAELAQARAERDAAKAELAEWVALADPPPVAAE